jgi:hypothetical protein
MRYGTWKISFADDPNHGSTPPNIYGEFYIDEDDLAGYLLPETLVADNQKWSMTEITEEQFFQLALQVNPNATMKDGKVYFPLPEN